MTKSQGLGSTRREHLRHHPRQSVIFNENRPYQTLSQHPYLPGRAEAQGIWCAENYKNNCHHRRITTLLPIVKNLSISRSLIMKKKAHYITVKTVIRGVKKKGTEICGLFLWEKYGQMRSTCTWSTNMLGKHWSVMDVTNLEVI